MDLHMMTEAHAAPRHIKADYGVKEEAKPESKLQSGSQLAAVEEPKQTTEHISSPIPNPLQNETTK
eukprot:365200-Chlamydomonas_euryale.AAC.13